MYIEARLAVTCKKQWTSNIFTELWVTERSIMNLITGSVKISTEDNQIIYNNSSCRNPQKKRYASDETISTHVLGLFVSCES